MVPSGWKLKTLSDITKEKVSYGIVQAGPHVSGGVPYLKSADVGGEIDIDSLQKTAPEIHHKYRRSAVHPGDIVFSLRGNIGRMSIVPNELIEANLTQGTARISVDENNDSKYIYYQIASTPVLNRINALSKGSTFKEISLEELRKVKVACAPLQEQQKIAKILSTWDNAISTTEKLIANNKQQKKALMQQLLTGKKRLVSPETGKAFDSEWENYSLSKVCKITKGKQLNRSTLKPIGKFPVINGGITPSGYTDSFNTKRNTITISEGGNSCGYIDFQKVDFWCGGHCYNLHEVTVDAEYLYQYLKFSERRIMSLRVGSGLPNIQKKSIESVPVLYPSKLEQQRIAAVLTAADKDIEVLEAKLAHFKQEKKALMQQLLTGKRRVALSS